MEKIHDDDDEPKSPGEENPTFSDQIPATFTEDILPSNNSEIENSIHSGFTDMLDIQDYSSTPCLFDMFQTPLPPTPPPPEMAITTTSGNSTSISSSSTEVTNDTTKTTPQQQQQEEDDPLQKSTINKHELKPKKKNTKRTRQPRFAFMTKSDVDHLDDGYRWRKYGQKAVKNSPFPRSYYRCTTTSCGVKKRVERSSQDPSIVVTTYEGTHTHQCPVAPPRGNNIGPVVPHGQMASTTGSSSSTVGGLGAINISPNLFISQPYNYQFYNHILSTTPPLPFDLSTNYNINPTTSNIYNPLLSDFIHQERFHYPPSSSSSSSPSSSSSVIRDSGLLQDMIMPSKAREGSKDDHDHQL